MYFCPQQAKTGIVMNIIGIVCVTLAINTWGKAMFHLDTFPAWANVTGVWTTSAITHHLCTPSSPRPRPRVTNTWNQIESLGPNSELHVLYCCLDFMSVLWRKVEGNVAGKEWATHGNIYTSQWRDTWMKAPDCLKLHNTNQMLSTNLKPGIMNYPSS